MEGRLSETLPQALAHCGIAPDVFSDDNGFLRLTVLSVDRLLRASRSNAQNAPTNRERAGFISRTRSIRWSGISNHPTPLFVYVQTWGPRPLRPGIHAGGERSGGRFRTSPEMSEYLRRAGRPCATVISSWTKSSAAFQRTVVSCAMRSPAERHDRSDQRGMGRRQSRYRRERRAGPSSASMRSKPELSCPALAEFDPLDIA